VIDAPSQPSIRCRALAKSFKTSAKEPGIRGAALAFFRPKTKVSHAVQSFDLEVRQGELVALLGPNGAGKTTLMKMLSGIIVPSSGEAEVLGHQPYKRDLAFRRRIALVMGQKSQLWWDIPAMDSFLLLKAYYELSEADFRRRLGDLTERLGVGALLTTHVRKLSLGERMKMELIASLLHAPQVMFLDEPTIGLDLVAQQAIRDFLREYHRQSSTTIILTSHYMADVQALCERIVLVLGGRKRFDGPLARFEGILGREKFLSVRFQGPVDTTDPLWQGLDPTWREGNSVAELRVADDRFRALASEILARFPVIDVTTDKLPIERVMSALLARPELLPEA
jgi:ABC-2 type transport system ATP-binding protein